MPVRLFSVVGRKIPTAKDPEPDVFRMKVFAGDEVAAKSRFWYFLPRLNKNKKMTGEILAVNEIFEKNNRVVKTYGVWLRYISRSGIHNMYKEFRDTTLTSAVGQLYSEMASRHRARNRSIQIIRTAVVPQDKVRSSNLSQFHVRLAEDMILRTLPVALRGPCLVGA
jgi:large subunit ribosomal protein L18Ae